MKRYLTQQQLNRLSKDFKFLIKRIQASRGEFDLRLREGYFNIYYKGNSLAKVTIKADEYVASIHQKFATGQVFRDDKRFAGKGIERGAYLEFHLKPDNLHSFFQKKYIDRIGSNIARVNYSQEITFEHMLITDNLDREDFFILDRQVTERALGRKRIDLLALRQKHSNQYQFVIVEVKLGNNPELRHEVAAQLSSYVSHVEARFSNWKESYEKTYRQMKELELFMRPSFESIEIIEGVHSMVCVGGYSGLAQESISELKDSFPEILVKDFKYRL